METIPKRSKPNNSKGSASPSSETHDDEVLLPGLPNHLAQLCLTPLPPPLLYSVSRSWRRLVYSPSFPPFCSLYALLSPKQTIISATSSIEFSSFDPLSSMWQSLPSPPKDYPVRLLHRHPSFLSRNLPIQSLTVKNQLVLVAGTTSQFLPALSRPLIFHPGSNRWFLGPQFSFPRRWCAAGSVAGTVYVASGVGSPYRKDVARSAERWDLKDKEINWRWEKMAGLKDGRFSRDAVEAVGYKGKLCMVNVMGNAVKEGLVYNVGKDRWEEMPRGMIAGWNGPATTMEEEVMYVVDEGKGSLCEYNGERDCWEKVIELPDLRRAEQVTAGRGKVCVVCENGERIVVVDVAGRPPRVWVVEPPCGQRVVAVHVLPRMSRPD